MSSTVQSNSGYMADEYFSGGLSISGLTESGSDFKTMIAQLRKIEMIPTQRMLRWKSEWQQRQEAFGIVREALTNLRDVCAKMNTMDRFLVKKATSSQPNIATATASSSAIGNSYKLEIDQVASTSIWSLKKEFADGSSLVNSSSTDSATFAYEYAGKVRSMTIPPNTSLEQFKNMINNDGNNPGIRASLVKSANGVTLQLKGMDQGKNKDLAILSTAGLDSFPPQSGYNSHTLSYTTAVKSTEATKANGDYLANTSADPQTFTYTYKGVTRNVSIPGKATITQFADAIKGDIATYKYGDPPASPPVDAHPEFDLSVELKTSGEYCELVFTGGTKGEAIVAPSGAGVFGNIGKPTTIVPEDSNNDPIDPDDWHVQHSQNAKIKVDGWPSGVGNWLEVSNNTVADVVEGVTFNLIGPGDTTVSVTTDSEAITENVVSFIDAVNEFRTIINELTKYDENKPTVDLNYAESQFEMQKGSILTGNYGVQLISSRIKQATAGMPFGFLPMFKQGDLMVGDLYTSLSQMGIKTKADGQGSEGFGLLELNTDPNFPLLEDVLKKNPEAVAEFFSAMNKGVSDSSHFSYYSSMEKITRPGAFEVKYELDANGKVIDGTAFINGKAAKYDPVKNQLGLTRIPPTTTDKDIAIATTDGSIDFNVDVKVEQLAQRASSSLQTELTSTTAAFASSDGTLSFTVGDSPNQKTYSVDVESGESLAKIAARVTHLSGAPGIRASVVKGDDGKMSLKIENTEDGKDAASVGQPTITFGTVTEAGTVTKSSQAAQDAVYKIANPASSGSYTQYTSKTNTITDKVTGAVITLKGAQTPADYANNAVKGASIVGEKHNDADGLYIQIDNMTPSQSYTGTVRIKQGKVNEILELLNGKPNKPEEGILGSKGTLQVLVDNYNKIIDGIDKKIERETARLIKWERTTKLRFSRLEATIKQYESLQTSIESQIKTLNTGSSKK